MSVESMWARGVAVASVAGAVLVAGASSAAAAVPGPIAGYSAPPSGAPTQTASTSVIVPTVSCATVPFGGFQAVVAGVRIEEPSGLTTGNTGGSVLLNCNGPIPTYQAHLQVDGTVISSGLTINPGDQINVTASVGSSAATVTVKDGAQSQTASGAGSTVIAEDVGAIAVNCAFAGFPCQPVPQSSPITFAGSRINGLDPLTAGATQRDLPDASGQTEMTSSALQEASKTRFKVSWLHSCGVGPGLC